MKTTGRRSYSVDEEGRKLMTNKILLSVVFFVIIITNIFAIKIDPIIEEFEIPMPEVQYELPEALIGEFIMVKAKGVWHLVNSRGSKIPIQVLQVIENQVFLKKQN